MRRVLCLTAVAAAVLCASCAKKEAPPPADDSLTIGNAAERYAGVMAKTRDRAREMEVLLPMKQVVDSFKVEQGRNPASLQELIDMNYLKELPKPPKGMEWTYDGATGRVALK